MKTTKLLMMLLLSPGLIANNSAPFNPSLLLASTFFGLLSSTGLIPDDKSGYYWWISPLIVDANELDALTRTFGDMHRNLINPHNHNHSKITPDELTRSDELSLMISGISGPNTKTVKPLPSLESSTDPADAKSSILSNDRNRVKTIKFGFTLDDLYKYDGLLDRVCVAQIASLKIGFRIKCTMYITLFTKTLDTINDLFWMPSSAKTYQQLQQTIASYLILVFSNTLSEFF